MLYVRQQELRTPGGYLRPEDVAHLATARDHALVERPHPKLERLREALGLPEPAHNRLAVEHKQVTWSTSGGNPYGWHGGRGELRADVQFGKGCFLVGWHTEQHDPETRQYLPLGPVAIGRLYRRHEETYEAHEGPSSTLPVLDARIVAWAQAPTGYAWNHGPLNGWSNANAVGVQVNLDGEHVWVYSGMDTAETVFGLLVNEAGNLEIDGRAFGSFPPLDSFLRRYYSPDDTRPFGFTMDDMDSLGGLHVGERSLNNMLHAAALRGRHVPTDDLEKPGLAKLYKERLKPLAEELLAAREYLTWIALRTLLKSGGRSISKVRVSTVANHELAGVTTVAELREKLAPLARPGHRTFESALESLDFFAEKRKEAVKRDTSKAIRKRVAELDEIEIDRERHPLTYGALTDGGIPLPCIFPSGETYFLTNDNWDLWEAMLARFPEETRKIAQEAAARRQYERDVMSYFYLVLHGLPEYLERHTGHAWTCSPRLVESQYELEPEAVEEDRGVIRKRSALTPVADNGKHHVVVPYCSMAVHGRMTTYCYAHSYHLLERGMVFDGNVVTREIEEKINGKDDYGLMFYTLTGSATNRGYPTFLVIFERLRRGSKTRVHFHRVHPMRSKDGDRNPVSNWIRVSYKWMIGNVSSDDVAFQQGDLAFVRISDEKAAGVDFSTAKEVSDCDSHRFTRPVKFADYEGKEKHVLGHVRIDEPGIRLVHPEHDNVSTRPGTYQVRQCRSWEANPKGIWTLNFD